MMAIALLLLVPTMGLADYILGHNHQASVKESSPDAGSAQSPDTFKWNVYRNEKYGFQVKYPDTWAVHSSRGTPPDVIYFSGTFRGTQRPQLDLVIQPNMNPRKLSVEEWFAEQQHVTGLKPEATGRLTIGGQPAVFMENSTRSGKERAAFVLLRKTDVLSFNYKLGSEDNPTYVAIIDSFRVLE